MIHLPKKEVRVKQGAKVLGNQVRVWKNQEGKKIAVE
jgi:hypothetical protein